MQFNYDINVNLNYVSIVNKEHINISEKLFNLLKLNVLNYNKLWMLRLQLVLDELLRKFEIFYKAFLQEIFCLFNIGIN